MQGQEAKHRWWLRAVALLAFLLLLLATRAASFLLVDAPRPSDVIVVLAGETQRRPERALQLLDQGYARHIILNVPTHENIFEFTQPQLAQKYIEDQPQAASISICPIEGFSTKDETKDVERCLKQEPGAKSILLVTSDFHTRRAFSIFRHELPQYQYSVAAARDDTQFGIRWWQHRQWAKIVFDEWLRLIWWQTVDRWR